MTNIQGKEGGVKKPTKQSLLTSTVFILAAIAITAIVYSEITAREYIRDLRSVADIARTSVKTLEDSVDSPLLYDPVATSEVSVASTQKIKNAITAYKAKINALSAKSNTLPRLEYAEHIGTFAVATTLQERSRHIVNQTNDILERYKQTIAFLEIYADSLDKSTKIMEEFNTISNFDEYAGRSDYFRQMSGGIQREADALSLAASPAELLPLKESSIQTLRQLASQLNDLANGMDVAIDDLIYGSVQNIESTNARLTILSDKTYGETISELRVINDIYDINEKFDLILQ